MEDKRVVGGSRGRMFALLICAAFVACACSASTTIEQTSAEADGSEQVESPTSDVQSDANEPDANEPDAADPAPSESSGTDSSHADSSAGAGSGASVEVRLLDPGAEPRTELRMNIAASCGEIMTLTQSQEMTQSVDGVAAPSAGVIGSTMEMAMSVAPNGDNYDVRAEVVGATASPDTASVLAAGLNAEFAKLVGLTSYSTMTDRGVLIPGSTRVEGAEALGPLAETLQSLNQAQAPLPVEAVGAGARWETTLFLETNGLLIETYTETTVVSIEGTIVELEATGFQRVGPGQVMSMQGFEAEITEWQIDNNGTMVIDLATISPIRATTSAVGTQAFSSPSIGGTLTQEIDTNTAITSAPDDGCTGRSIAS